MALKILAAQLRASMQLSAQYRFDFVVEGAVEILWAASAVIPLLVVYGQRPSIAGFTFHEAAIILGWFTMLQGLLEGVINPSMGLLVEQIRKGTFDFVLLKPADAQLLTSFARVQPWKSFNLLVGLAVVAWARSRCEQPLSPGQLAQGASLWLVSASILYSLWICAACAAFSLVKVDNLTYLFSSVFDAARWPSSVFRGPVRAFFTWVIPLGVMTTFPAEALLGRLPWGHFALAWLGAAAALLATRWLFRRTLASYTSAGGLFLAGPRRPWSAHHASSAMRPASSCLRSTSENSMASSWPGRAGMAQ